MQISKRHGVFEAVVFDRHRQVHARHDDSAPREARAGEEQARLVVRRAAERVDEDDERLCGILRKRIGKNLRELPRTSRVVGIAEIDGFRIDAAFLGTCALSLDGGLMSTDAIDQCVKRKIIETARKNIAVVDHTKLCKDAFLRVCDIKKLDSIITDKEADASFVASARKLGIEVVQV